MAFVVKLPEILAIEILISFCDPEDLFHLDLAFCSSTDRPELLALLQNDACVIDNWCKSERRGPIQFRKLRRWIFNRKIHITKMFLGFEYLNIPDHFDTNNINDLSITTDGLTQVVPISTLINTRFQNISKLTLFGFSALLSQTALVERFDQRILQNITHFSSSGGEFLHSELLRCLSSQCISLQHFTLKRKQFVTQIGVDPSQAHLIKLFQKNPHLKELVLNNISIETETVDELLKNCLRLSKIEISCLIANGINLEASQIAQLIGTMKHLTYLYIDSGSGSITYFHNSNQKSLNVRRCFGGAAGAYNSLPHLSLSNAAKGLTSIEMRDFSYLTAEVYDAIIRNHGNTLTEFILHDNKEHCHVISESIAGLQRLFAECRNLTNVKFIMGCDHLTLYQWSQLFSSPNHLKTLTFHNNTVWVDATVLSDILHKNKHLQQLVIEHCHPRLTEKKIQAAVKKLKLKTKIVFVK